MSQPVNRKLRAIAGGLAGHAAALRQGREVQDVGGVLNQLDRVISSLEPADWPALALAVAARLATIASFMLTTTETGSSAQSAGGPDRYVTPEEAAEIAGVSRRWIYRNTRGQRFRRDLSRKQVRLHEAGFRRWLATRSLDPGIGA